MSTSTFDLAGKRVYVAGHKGMVGRAVCRRLASEGCTVLSAELADLDLTRQSDTEAWFQANRPDAVVMAAAKVGGIVANSTYPAEFLIENLLIEVNTIVSAQESGVKKFLMLGSSCIYPKFASQPIHEDSLLTGPLEPTNEWYAVAKICGLKMCEALYLQYGLDFVSAMPCNLYGTYDNFNLQSSHVIPALMRKIHTAKVSGSPTVTIWGTGTPLREFLYVDDLADGLVWVLKNYSSAEHLNIGSGSDQTITEVAKRVAEVVGYTGEFVYDTSKPDGTPRKLLDVSRLAEAGWSPKTSLKEGLAATYAWFLESGLSIP